MPAYPDHSWPRVSGGASCMWVRPIFTISIHSPALAAMASRRAFTEGTNRPIALTAAAIYMAEGKESFDDCAMFTWSFGWTGALLARGVPASWQQRFEITLFTFM